MDSDLLLVFLAGFVASFVDGALGMGFGPTSATILLSTGLAPAAVSTTVNIAKVATGLAAAVSHWRFGNIDRALVLRLAVPGMVGALIGVTVLANVDGDLLRPILAALLLVVGLRILVRYSTPFPVTTAVAVKDEAEHQSEPMPDWNQRGTIPVATAGGVTNGLIGAWGPVVTPFLLQRGLPPRFAIGSVNTAEVAVAVVASGTLLASIGGGDLDPGVVLAMLLGGVLAAPLAAYVIRFLPPRALGLAVASLLMFTNIRELAGWADLGAVRWVLYALVPILVTIAALRPRWSRTAAQDAAAPAAESDTRPDHSTPDP